MNNREPSEQKPWFRPTSYGGRIMWPSTPHKPFRDGLRSKSPRLWPDLQTLQTKDNQAFVGYEGRISGTEAGTFPIQNPKYPLIMSQCQILQDTLRDPRHNMDRVPNFVANGHNCVASALSIIRNNTWLRYRYYYGICKAKLSLIDIIFAWVVLKNILNNSAWLCIILLLLCIRYFLLCALDFKQSSLSIIFKSRQQSVFLVDDHFFCSSLQKHE